MNKDQSSILTSKFERKMRLQTPLISIKTLFSLEAAQIAITERQRQSSEEYYHIFVRMK